ncbi:MAG TPA: hypothetical protein PK765_01780 [bacterium]|nr:hypothetical protein [bacterium]
MKLPTNLFEDALDIIGTYRYHFMLTGIYLLIMGATAFYAFSRVLPTYAEKQPIIDEANTLNASIQNIKAHGLTVAEFTTISKKINSDSSSTDIAQDKGKLQKALTKPRDFRGDYLAWLADEMKLSEKRGIEIDRNERILRSILPSFISADKQTAGSLATTGETLTLENFIEYVETNILRRFNIQSNASVGINGMEFEENTAGTLNIGSFIVRIDFQGEIEDIRKMIEFLQSSGKFSIKNGRIEGELPSEQNITTLSENLLVDIREFSINGWLPSDDPLMSANAETSGSVALEFYVQGNNSQKVLLMRTQVLNAYKDLEKKIQSYDSYCEKTAGSPCSEESVRLAVVAIRNQASSLESYSDRIDVISRRKEVSRIDEEMSELMLYARSIEQIDTLVERNIKTIDSATKPSAKSAPTQTQTATGSTNE